MTAGQMKRIRKRLDDAARLTAEAHDLAKAGHGDYRLREFTARAADEMDRALRSLRSWDMEKALQAEAIARSLTGQ